MYLCYLIQHQVEFMVVLSAYKINVVFFSTMLLTQILKSKGYMTEPCGTPIDIEHCNVRNSFTNLHNKLFAIDQVAF